jgi:hypothetical protein
VDPLELTIDLPGGRVSALLLRPKSARFLYLMAHGAGAGMRHAFLEAMAGALATRGIATLRYQFPYMEAKRRRPDPPAELEAAVRAAAARAAQEGLPLFAGGKSLGGRMTSRAQAAAALLGVRGLVFLGFPLHPAGAPGTERAEHLGRVTIPMLFLQGTRDDLADLALIGGVCARLGERAALHVLRGADHGFHVLRSSGRSDVDVLEEIASEILRWASRIGA